MPPRTSTPAHSLWFGIWPLYLLLLEYLAISVHFDAKPLLAAMGGSGSGLGYLGYLAPLLLVVATATFVLSGSALRAELGRLWTVAPVFDATRRWALSANLACYALLWLQTARLFSDATDKPSSAAVLGFLLLAAACAGSLLIALVPPAALRNLLPAAARAVALGVCAGALAWAAGLASERLWAYLQQTTLYSVRALLVPFCDRVEFDAEEAIIGTPSFVVQVAPECSGLEGIGLISVVMGVYLVSARRRLAFPRALALIPLAIALVFVGNALRIALLIAVGANGSPDIALSGFHSKAGWLFFCAVALSLIAFVQRTHFFQRSSELLSRPAATSGDDDHTWNPAAAYLMPLLTLIATSLVTALFSTGFDRLYGLRIVTVGLVLFYMRRHGSRWPPSWHAPAIGCAVFALWLWLVPLPPAAKVAELREHIAALGAPWSSLWIALRALGSAVVVPIAEELAFRGFLLRRLIDSDFTAVDERKPTLLALAVSSLAFAALHPGAWLAAGLAGLAYAGAQCIRGRTTDAIVAHAITNAAIAGDVMAHDAYWLWV